MSYSLIAHQKGGLNGTFSTTAINTTGADIIFWSVVYYSGGSDPTLTDTASNTWHQAGSTQTEGAIKSKLYYAYNASTNSSHTFTLTGASYATSVVYAFSGSQTSSDPKDQTGGNGATTGTSISANSGGNLTPGSANEIIVVQAGFNGSSSITISGSFSAPDTFDLSGIIENSFSYWIQTTATATNPTWSWLTSGDVGTNIGTFKSSGGATGKGFYQRVSRNYSGGPQVS